MSKTPLSIAIAANMSQRSAPASTADRSLISDASLRKFLVSFEEGTQRFMNGDDSLWMQNLSRRDDVAIMGAWGAHERGWDAVSSRYRWASGRFGDSGAKLSVEYLTSVCFADLAFTTAIERASVRVTGSDDAIPMALRVTHVFRREDGQWKLVLRHADPLIAKTAPQSVLQK